MKHVAPSVCRSRHKATKKHILFALGDVCAEPNYCQRKSLLYAAIAVGLQHLSHTDNALTKLGIQNLERISTTDTV